MASTKPLIAVATANSTTGAACVEALLGRYKGKREQKKHTKDAELPPSSSPFLSFPLTHTLIISTLLQAGTVRVRGAFRSAEKAAPFKARFGESGLYESVESVDADDLETLSAAFEDATGAVIVTPMDHRRGTQ